VTFAELGFERASVDAIAARAGVSKATLYNHFADKSALFVACFSEGVETMCGELKALLAETSDDLEKTLQRAGERMISVFVSPEALGLHRAATEAASFPEVRRMFFERGACVTFESIAAYLARWAERGALSMDDPHAAAVQFVMMCHGDLVMKVRLGVVEKPSAEQIRETVRRAVETFLRAFRS
jgi:TetR/AcrR family transcriptional regulator, mexJK operon transcriptional repressor